MSVVTGSVPLPNNQKLSEQPSIRDFGGKGDGVTNNVAAFSRAVAGLPVGGTLFLPRGDYLLKGSGTELILVNKPLSIVGEGWMTRLLVDPTVPATTDVIRLYNPGGAVIENYWNMTFSDFYVKVVSGTPARHTLVIDGTDGHFTRMSIKRLSLFPMNPTGSGILLINPSPPFNDRFFTSMIGPNNVIFGGINLEGCGDSVWIYNNTITGANAGVRANLVKGASELLIKGNNITSQGGAVHLLRGNRVKILYNNIENPTLNSSANAAMIDIDGIPGDPCLNVEVRGNYLGADVVPNISCIRVNWADYCHIDDNTMTFSGTGFGVKIEANATNTKLGDMNNAISSPLAWIQDNAALTLQTTQYSGPLSGATQREGNRILMTGFTGTWAGLNGSDRRLLTGTLPLGNTIKLAMDGVIGPMTGTPSVVTYNDELLSPSTPITGGSVSGGLITLTTGPRVMNITAAANTNPAVLTAVHGMLTGDSVTLSGFTGAWAAANGLRAVTVIDETSFSIPIDSTVFGAIAGLPIGTLTGCGFSYSQTAPNTGFGYHALTLTSLGGDNTSFGYNCLYSNRTGSRNTAIGSAVMQFALSNDNTGVGALALQALTNGIGNTAVGSGTLAANVKGNSNTAVGTQALQLCTGGTNVAVGASTGANLTTGNGNVLVGQGAGFNLNIGSFNVCVGTGAGQTALQSGFFNVCIGNGAQVSGTNAQYQTVIGAGALGGTDNSVTLGRAADSIILPSLISAPALGTDAAGKIIPVTPGSSSLATRSVAATSGLTLTGTMADVPGATVSLTAGVWLVMAVFTFSINSGGNASGGLNVGGTLQTAVATTSTTASSANTVPATQAWIVTVVGTQTAKLQASIGGLAAGSCVAGNTTINCVKVG